MLAGEFETDESIEGASGVKFSGTYYLGNYPNPLESTIVFSSLIFRWYLSNTSSY